MENRNTILKELQSLSPMLAEKRPGNPYAVPPGYFEALPGRVMVQLVDPEMPVSRQMPYQWYNTPNIHLCTVKDFEALVKQIGGHITGKQLFLDGKPVHCLGGLRSTLAVYRFRP